MATLSKTLKSGILYTAIAKYSSIFLSILIGAILARLLTPKEFGIVAIVTVFVTFFNLLSDFGLGPAVVQNQELTEQDVQSIFSFSILFGIILALLFFFCAPLIANFYHDKELIKVSRLLSIAILFYSFQIIPKALAQKKMRFRQIGIISVIAQIINGTIAIILAYNGFSYYSLVIKSILDSLLTLIAFYWLTQVKFTFRIQKNSIKKIARFSSFQFLFNFINYFSRNSDNLLIGKYFGAASLGYYDKSYRLMMLPVQNLTHVITPVLLPVLAIHQDNKALVYANYLEVVRILATIGFPLSIYLYFSAPEIINIIYGPQWNNSIPVFKLLAFTVGLQMVLSSSGAIFQTVNRTDLLFYSGFLSSVFMMGGISYGVFIGKTLVDVGYGLIIAFVINFFQGFYILIRIALKNSFSKFLKTFILPIAISTSIAIVLNIASADITHMNKLYTLFLKTSISTFIFAIIILISKKNRILLKHHIKKLNNNHKR